MTLTPTVFRIKHGDTKPSIRVVVKDDYDEVVDLTGWTVRFHLTDRARSTLLIDALATIVTAADGVVEYDWVAGDTSRIGDFLAEWAGTDPTGGLWTFPNDSDTVVRIVREIG